MPKADEILRKMNSRNFEENLFSRGNYQSIYQKAREGIICFIIQRATGRISSKLKDIA
jgi:hypothetical protein